MILNQGMKFCRMRRRVMSEPYENMVWKQSESSSWSFLSAWKW